MGGLDGDRPILPPNRLRTPAVLLLRLVALVMSHSTWHWDVVAFCRPAGCLRFHLGASHNDSLLLKKDYAGYSAAGDYTTCLALPTVLCISTSLPIPLFPSNFLLILFCQSPYLSLGCRSLFSVLTFCSES